MGKKQIKKLPNEAELVKEALRIIMIYAEHKGVVKFEPTDSQKDKIAYAYRFLLHEKQIQPLARGQEDQPHMRHKLAMWISRKLPDDHPLLRDH